MSGRSRQSLRGLTLAVLIPCLLFSAALSGWTTYRDLYRVILTDGFEKKLDVVSTGVAAFIDGEAHAELERPTTVSAITGDPTRPFLWGLDPEGGRVVRVDLIAGGATGYGPLPIPDAVGLAWDVRGGALLTMRPATGEMFAFHPDSSEVREAGRVDAGAWALDIDSSGTRLTVAGPWGVRGYVPGDAGWRAAWTQAVDVQAITFSRRSGDLYALGRDGSLLVSDGSGGSFRDVGPLEPGDDEAQPEVLGSVRALAASHLTPLVFAAGTRLISLSPEERTYAVARYRRGYRDESGPIYTRYVEPMRRIRSTLDLTYLYTQNLVPGDSIQYLVDSTPLGDDHSPIGTREALETEADIRGLNDLMDRGLVYSSEIEDSEEWGLLKSTFAPIVGARGEPVGMVGADISVSTIQDRTQIALAKVGLVTVVILFLGGLGAVGISLRLTGPLAAVQEGASKVAAGRAGEPIEPPRLKDLAILTASFNEMTQTLTSSVNDLQEETRRVEAMRTRRYLVQELGSRERSPAGLPRGVSAEGSLDAAAQVVALGSHAPGMVVVRLSEEVEESPLDALAEREEFALVARRVSAENATPEQVLETLGRFWGFGPDGILVVDASTGVWAASPEARIRATLRAPDGRERSLAGTGSRGDASGDSEVIFHREWSDGRGPVAFLRVRGGGA